MSSRKGRRSTSVEPPFLVEDGGKGKGRRSFSNPRSVQEGQEPALVMPSFLNNQDVMELKSTIVSVKKTNQVGTAPKNFTALEFVLGKVNKIDIDRYEAFCFVKDHVKSLQTTDVPFVQVSKFYPLEGSTAKKAEKTKKTVIKLLAQHAGVIVRHRGIGEPEKKDIFMAFGTAAAPIHDDLSQVGPTSDPPTTSNVDLEATKKEEDAREKKEVCDYCTGTMVPFFEEYVFPGTDGFISVAPDCSNLEALLDRATHVFSQTRIFCNELAQKALGASGDALKICNLAISFCHAVNAWFLIKMDLLTDAENELEKAITFDETCGKVYCQMVKTCTLGNTCKDVAESRQSCNKFKDYINHDLFRADPFAFFVRRMCINAKNFLSGTILTFDPDVALPIVTMEAVGFAFDVQGPTIGYSNWGLAELVATAKNPNPNKINKILDSIKEMAERKEQAFQVVQTYLGGPENEVLKYKKNQRPIALFGQGSIPAKMYLIGLARRSVAPEEAYNDVSEVLAAFPLGDWEGRLVKTLGQFIGIYPVWKSYEDVGIFFAKKFYMRTMVRVRNALMEARLFIGANENKFAISFGILECNVLLMEAWASKKLALMGQGSMNRAINVGLQCLTHVKEEDLPLSMCLDILQYLTFPACDELEGSVLEDVYSLLFGTIRRSVCNEGAAEEQFATLKEIVKMAVAWLDHMERKRDAAGNIAEVRCMLFNMCGTFVNQPDLEWVAAAGSDLSELENKKIETLDFQKTFDAKCKKSYVATRVALELRRGQLSAIPYPDPEGQRNLCMQMDDLFYKIQNTKEVADRFIDEFIGRLNNDIQLRQDRIMNLQHEIAAIKGRNPNNI